MGYALKALKSSTEGSQHGDLRGKAASMLPEPYLHCQYNVKTFFPSSYTRGNVMSGILNKLMDAFKENALLPRFIIIIPYDSFLAMLNHTEYGVSLMIGKCLHWLITEVDKLVDTRRAALLRRKPGAVTPHEPKVMWIKMLEFPGRDRYALVRSKFDIILEQVLAQTRKGFIMKATECDNIQRNWFDMMGHITHDGCIQYWCFISYQLQRFDSQAIELLLDGKVAVRETYHDRPENDRRMQLPAPPPPKDNRRHFHEAGYRRC